MSGREERAVPEAESSRVRNGFDDGEGTTLIARGGTDDGENLFQFGEGVVGPLTDFVDGC